MIPAPGLIALVLSPVSQFEVAEKPIASWQLPLALAGRTQLPIRTLQLPESKAPGVAARPPASLPTKVLNEPVTAFPAAFPTAVLLHELTTQARAFIPRAEFKLPVLFPFRLKAPTAVLQLAVQALDKASLPTAVLQIPVVVPAKYPPSSPAKAPDPTATFSLPEQK
jgi:hypothetical protein